MKHFSRMKSPCLIILLLIWCKNLVCQVENTMTDQELLDSAFVLNQLGIKYGEKGDHNNAFKYFKESHELKLNLDPQKYASRIARGYNNIAFTYYRTWNFDSALIYYNHAKFYYQKSTQDPTKLGLVNSNIGRVYWKTGDFNMAELYYKEALTIFKLKEYNRGIASAYNLLGILENQRANYLDAIDYFKAASDKSAAINKNAFTNISYCYMMLEDSLNCYLYISKAIEETNKSSTEPNISLASRYRDYAEYLTGFSNYKLAEDYFIKTETVLNSFDSPADERSILYYRWGKLHYQQGKYLQALQSYQTAISLISHYPHALTTHQNPDPEQLIALIPAVQILKDKTECLYKLFEQNKQQEELDACLSTSLLAMDLIEKVRLSFQTYESKIFLAENQHDIYQTALYCAWLIYNQSKSQEHLELAFQIAEKSKSSVLLSALRESEAYKGGGIPDSLITLENDLSRQISFYKEQIYEEELLSEPNTEKLELWQNYIFEYSTEYAALKENLEKDYPDFYNLKLNTEVINIGQVQQLLNSRTTLLEYALSDSLLYAFTITKNSSKLDVIPADKKLHSAVTDYLEEFRSFDFFEQTNERFDNFSDASHELYKRLIPESVHKHTNSELIIITDDILSFVPFESLICTPKDDHHFAYKNLDFMIKHRSISYAYSSTILQESMKDKSTFEKLRFLAVAPEYKSSTSNLNNNLSFVTRQKYRDELKPIPGALAESKSIATLMSGDVLFDSTATETKFKAAAGEYNLLHLAMHTLVDDVNPMYSKLIFSAPSDSSEDGYLNTEEIFNLSLKAKLAVLSSCSTAEGKLNKGEGVMSLARGFSYAGCPSLVMTLWKVEDNSGVELMNLFYKNLLKGKTKPKALQQAKLQYLEHARNQNSHPFFWSTYICLGNTDPVTAKPTIKYILGSISLTVIISTLILLIRRRRQ